MSTIHHPPPLTPARRIAAPQPPRSPHGNGPSLIYAGWGVRGGALFIDWLIAFAAAAVFYIVGFAMLASPSTIQVGLFVLLATYVLGPLVGFAFYAWQMCRGGERNGQTIGKTALKIRVVRADGLPVGFGTVLMRHVVIGLLYIVTLGVGIIVDYLWPLWDERSQTLHDKIAGTYVVRTERPGGAVSPAPPPRPMSSMSALPAGRPSPVSPPEGPPRGAPVVEAPAVTPRPPAIASGSPTRPAVAPPTPDDAHEAITFAATAASGAGATIASYCSACGHSARTPDRFCLQCGTQLTHAPRPLAPTSTAPALAHGPAARTTRLAAMASAAALVAITVAVVALLGPSRAAPEPSVAAGLPSSASQPTPVTAPLAPAAEPATDAPPPPPPPPAVREPVAAAPSRPPVPTREADAPAATVRDADSSPQAGTAAGPGTTLRRHFEHLDNGEFEAAFALMSPAYRNSSPQWPAARRQAAPAVRIDAIELAHISGDEADVPVTFYARDSHKVRGSDTACRRFNGSAHLRRIDGLWRYDPLANNLSVAILPPTNSRCP